MILTRLCRLVGRLIVGFGLGGVLTCLAELGTERSREASVNEIRSVLSLPTWRTPEIDRLLLFAADRELGFLREKP